eukprot:CAMPEP_0174259136 /NCGR_PEP_ID=MMETSP0439-20130205/8009_1 /TAXON_ID=0 /ORGANISM="Stereomyxa ramosa, Strain Chinc5" /LENGTH=463 /DNA_ID=CAMNT_0015342917 /DNA_START=46 /DNA_END=1440 /DNA_ORIENTATION=+
MSLLLLACVLLFLAGIYYVKLKFSRPSNAPPMVPGCVPFVGHVKQIMGDSTKFITKAHEEVGNVFTIKIMGRNINICDETYMPILVKAADDTLNFSKGTNALGNFRIALDTKHTFTPKVVRSRVNFNLIGFAEAADPVIRKAVREAIGKKVIVDDLETWINKIVAKGAARCMVGEETCEIPELLETLRTFSKDVETVGRKGRFCPAFVGRYLAKKVRVHYDIIEKHLFPVVQARKKAEAEGKEMPVDFLQFYMDLRDENGERFSDGDVLRQFGPLIFASMSTTTMAVTRSLQTVVGRPEVVKKMQEEWEEKVKDGVLDFATVKTLSYTEGVIRETLRIQCGVFNPPRLVEEDVYLENGMVLPKGELFAISPRLMNFREDLWEDPYEYKPERFLAKAQPKKYLGFGLGKHLCPGRFFALSLSKMILYHLLHNRSFNTTDGIPPKLHDTGFAPSYELKQYVFETL